MKSNAIIKGYPSTGRENRPRISSGKIILFGSHARGDAGPDSDVDLMVIMNSDEHPARTAARITHRVHPRRYGLDLIVRSPETIRARLHMNDWFLRDVMREGRVLYA